MKFSFIYFPFFVILFSCKSNLKKIELHYKNGQLKEVYNIDNNKNEQGIGYSYFKDGTIKEIRTYKNGKSNGKCYYYYPNGKLNAKITYLKNIEVDTSYIYNINGNLESITIYNEESKPLKDFFFYKNGKIKLKRAFVTSTGQIHSYIEFDQFGFEIKEKSKYVKYKYFNDSF